MMDSTGFQLRQTRSCFSACPTITADWKAFIQLRTLSVTFFWSRPRHHGTRSAASPKRSTATARANPTTQAFLLLPAGSDLAPAHCVRTKTLGEATRPTRPIPHARTELPVHPRARPPRAEHRRSGPSDRIGIRPWISAGYKILTPRLGLIRASIRGEGTCHVT
jgi:hypothetical protein